MTTESVYICPRGHRRVQPYSKGTHKGPSCPICLSIPVVYQIAHLSFDRRSQVAALAEVFASVTRRISLVDVEVEAMSLALGRDKDWRLKQVEVMRAIQKSLMVAKIVEDKKVFFSPMDKLKGVNKEILCQSVYMEWFHYANLLIDAGILDVVTLILQIRLTQPTEAKVDRMVDPWHSVYYYSLDIIANIMLTSYWDNPRGKGFIRKLSQSGFMDAAMAFIDDSKHFLAKVMSIYVLCHVYEHHPSSGGHLVPSGLLSQFGHLIHKDNALRSLNTWMSSGLYNYELEVLMENQFGLLPMKTITSFEPAEVIHFSDDDIKDVGIQFASTLQQSCLQCIGYLCKEKHIREVITKDAMISKAIIRWLRMPVLSPENRFMLEVCLKVLHEMVQVSDFAWKLLDEYGFMELLENGVYYPSSSVVWHYTEVANGIAMNRGLLLKYIVENSTIMRAAAIHMYSLECNCYVYGTALMALALDNPGIDNVIKYFGPRNFYFYPDYYFNKAPIVGIKITELEVGCKRFSRKKYGDAQREFRKTRNLTLDGAKAQTLKEEGNRCYKNGQCQEAVTLYTQAIEVCPPTRQIPGEARRGSNPMPKWFALAATLLSNRAQCYLNLGEYKKAIEDCDEAIARCLGGTDDDDPALPEKVRVKAMFRRSKALYETGLYFRAVQDVAECQMTQPSETFKAHLDKAMMRFRVMMGKDPIQRCDECLHANGFKLKRCACCMAVYCSKKCQEIAWIKRHKANCQEYQAEKLAASQTSKKLNPNLKCDD